ncbi:cytochrome c biogenesis protein CcsA [Sporolituus thermophilus]|uniref:Cytochrome c-type biogenesis protein CcmF n=1 Tax=Sporolituus thermophilus DSM 23256 TaxID=1123285 RepID=A0A1G7LZT8_9FIRM|nr:cytochrome c biogenesis protein CcsA [Sporolituus thermophilus]SDF54469.1 cytochrome c-type biogenesis protein CcmF [Sporolituus thermophilus DSM 23256]
MVGFAALFLALIATGISVFSYFNAHFAQVNRPTGKVGPRGNCALYYLVSAVFIGIAAIYLLILILSNQFQYAYVFSYSAKDLPLAYKISAFWAGQEGSFLLWLVFHALFGIILSRQQAVAAGTMAAYGLVQLVLLTILLAKNPFMMLVEPRADGAGLNPLLQDPWMAIHPPLIFLGYAGLTIPFAYAMGGLLANEHRRWIEQALPWTLFAWSVLGAGIFIGGFWAYKVLGWGGYWAWDPVENSSLVPWLTAGALVHFLLIAKVRPAAVKPSCLASVFTFVLVLYGTFLTRSGILSDFSTHSFTDEGVGGLLAGMVMLVTAAALVLLIIRWPGLPAGDIYPAVKSREFMMAAGALTLAALAALVLVGMSTPLITMLLGNPQNVSAAFYNTSSLPLAALLLLFLTIAPLVAWGENRTSLLKKYWWLLAIGLAGLLLSIWFGIRDVIIMTVLSLALTALLINLGGNRRGLTWAGAITHAGVAVMIIGIIASSTHSRTEVLDFAPGQTHSVFGKKITYAGIEPAADGKGFFQSFQLETQDMVRVLTKLNWEGRPAVREPGIHRELGADLYFAPVMKDERVDGKEITLAKGEEKSEEGLTIKFSRFGMTGHDAQTMRVYALLEVAKEGRTEEVKPELAYVNGQFKPLPAKAFGDYELALYAVNTAEGKIRVAVRNLAAAAKPDAITVEISHKPLINLVWLGAAVIAFGTLWAGWNRARHIIPQREADPSGPNLAVR